MVVRALREGPMFTIPELAADALGSHLAEHMGRRFGSTDAGLIERVQSAARLAIDCIGNSDALYHNVEHTMLVTLVGYDILRGRQLLMETNARISRTLSSLVCFTTLVTFAVFLKAIAPTAILLTPKATKPSCRAARPTPRYCRITSTVQSCT